MLFLLHSNSKQPRFVHNDRNDNLWFRSSTEKDIWQRSRQSRVFKPWEQLLIKHIVVWLEVHEVLAVHRWVCKEACSMKRWLRMSEVVGMPLLWCKHCIESLRMAQTEEKTETLWCYEAYKIRERTCRKRRKNIVRLKQWMFCF